MSDKKALYNVLSAIYFLKSYLSAATASIADSSIAEDGKTV